MCSIIGQGCINNTRIDDFTSYKQTIPVIIDLNKSKFYISNDDISLQYAFGECYKGRDVNRDDLNLLASLLGGECEDCVCWKNN